MTIRILALCMVAGVSMVLVPYGITHADLNTLTLTVAPPLIQVNLQPGETWTTGIRVVNGNAYPLTVYAQPLLFEPQGDTGRPRFKDSPQYQDEDYKEDPTTLAGWITVPRAALTIPSEQTLTLPVSIDVPEDAAPGGHYAAILIGNRTPKTKHEDSTVSVSSSIASLIFLRVAGDVQEKGRIRDFATEKSLYNTSEAHLSLRFENQGNVHLRPSGDITIYNMLGKKRGVIPVNQSGDYGNVLPGSMRKFSYNWNADLAIWDIGRYRAEATLGYGADKKQFTTAATYFYILPIVPLLEVLGGVIALFWFVAWSLRLYVRRALLLEARNHGTPSAEPHAAVPAPAPHNGNASPVSIAQAPVRPSVTITTLVRPIQVGMVDLRQVAARQPVHGAAESEVRTKERLTAALFMRKYKMFFGILAVGCAIWIGVRYLLTGVVTPDRPFEYHQIIEE